MILLNLVLFTLSVCLSISNALSVTNRIAEFSKPTTVDEGKDIFSRALSATHKTMGRASRSKRSESSCTGNPVGKSIDPLEFGADPTGRTDSTDAILMAVAAAFNVSNVQPIKMASNINNLGGATLDLNGGEYLISKPIPISLLVGNVRIRGGTLRASQSFPSASFLIEVGSSDCKPADKQNVCNEFIVIEDMFLDGSHIAAGGINVFSTMGTTIGPSMFITGFNEAGVRVNQGHETMVFDSWIAEYYWSDSDPSKDKCNEGTGGSIGIELNGEDNYVTNVIIFDFTCLGVLVNGAASILDGVHSWNGGGVAIKVNGTYDIQDRILNCYLDYSTLMIVNPKFVLVEGNFFYETHAVLVGPQLNGLTMKNNIYSMNQCGGNVSVVLDNEKGGEPTCHNVVIEDEINGQQSGGTVSILQTTARKSLYQMSSKVWQVDFSSILLLSEIEAIDYSFVLSEDSSLPAHAARTPKGKIVTIETSEPVTGTVHVTARQCQ